MRFQIAWLWDSAGDTTEREDGSVRHPTILADLIVRRPDCSKIATRWVILERRLSGFGNWSLNGRNVVESGHGTPYRNPSHTFWCFSQVI